MDPMEPDEHAHGLGPSRARVLALLQDAGEPMSAHDVGARLGLHANSVRFHLDALVDAGLVTRDREVRTTRGRPRVRYAATTLAPRASRREYRALSTLLADVLHDRLPDAGSIAEQAGLRWAQTMPSGDRSGVASEPAALELLVDTLADVGFESRVTGERDDLRVEVSHCPFLEVAEGREDVVCGIHLGLMRGVLERAGAPLGVRDLQPLVEPSLCVAHLSR
jgi:predicted ArsR family transcriptional regulator